MGEKKKNQMELVKPRPQNRSQRKLWHSAFAVDEAQCSSPPPPDSCQLFGMPHHPGEEELDVLWSPGSSEPPVCRVGKSFRSQAPMASQAPGRRLPCHHAGAPSLMPSLRSIQPPSNLSPPREQCLIQIFSSPGASVDLCPIRNKSEHILLCDTDIVFLFR